jgi:hypothetical protein
MKSTCVAEWLIGRPVAVRAGEVSAVGADARLALKVLFKSADAAVDAHVWLRACDRCGEAPLLEDLVGGLVEAGSS